MNTGHWCPIVDGPTVISRRYSRYRDERTLNAFDQSHNTFTGFNLECRTESA